MQDMPASPWTQPRSLRYTAPEDVMVQVSIRMPFWYREKLQRYNETESIAMILLELAARFVPPIKEGDVYEEPPVTVDRPMAR